MMEDSDAEYLTKERIVVSDSLVCDRRRAGRFDHVSPRLIALLRLRPGTGIEGIEDQGVEDQGVEDQGVENQGVENQGVDDLGPARGILTGILLGSVLWGCGAVAVTQLVW